MKECEEPNWVGRPVRLIDDLKYRMNVDRTCESCTSLVVGEGWVWKDTVVFGCRIQSSASFSGEKLGVGRRSRRQVMEMCFSVYTIMSEICPRVVNVGPGAASPTGRT